jgi:hypothetical protein
METFTELKELAENPNFKDQRRKVLAGLTDDMIDLPIIGLINHINRLPYCFTLQSCYGHFVHDGQKNPNNFEPLPDTNTIDRVEYRIAYIAFCIDNRDSGRKLFNKLKKITTIDPENIQFCCAEWFWERQINSYALQVEPDRYKHKDKALLEFKEALKIEHVRNEFFVRLNALFQKL